MPGVKLKMDVELDALRANVTALQAMTKKTAQQCVRETAIRILQSAAKLTPIAKRKNRDIIRAVRRYRYGVEELVRNARPEAPGDRAMWLISRPRNRRPISKSGDRRFWVFETAAAARDHRVINFRGVAKAGWWSQLPALGKAVPGSYSQQSFLADVPGIRETVVHLDDLIPEITLHNRSIAIQSGKAESIRKQAILRANNAIAGMARRSERSLAAFKAAGGVAWQQAGTFNGESVGSYVSMED